MIKKKENSKFTKVVENTSTKDLENFFSNSKKRSVKDLLKEKSGDFVEVDKKNFSLYIKDKAKDRKMFQNEVAYKAGLGVRYGEKVFGGATNPKKDTVLRLAITMGFDLTETNRALRYANKQPLYPKYKRDAALIKIISENVNSVEDANDILEENGLKPLEACSKVC